MQRRAAAAYAALFILVAVGAYVMVGVAEEPDVEVANPDFELSAGQEFEVGGRTYTVGEISGTSRSSLSTDLAWTNQSARYTATWEDGATILYDDVNFSVTTQPNASPAAVALAEVRTVPENLTTVADNGTTYVIVHADGERTLVPEEAYLRDRYGPQRTERFEVGDSLEYDNTTVTLASVSAEAATLEWTAPRENTVTAEHGANVTLGPNEKLFVAHFSDGSTLQLTDDVGAYQEELRVQDTYHERVNGLWGVSILSMLAATFLLAAAYLPSRY